MRRRHFFTVTSGGVFVATLDGRFELRAAEPRRIRVALRFFTEQESRTLAAAVERIFPADENGPGAGQAGVVIYIDRQLASGYGKDKFRYRGEPFLEGPAELGYQGALTPREIYRQGLAELRGLEQLAPAAQDARLRAIGKTLFFDLLRRHTIEGMFCDPMHGGNARKAGWRLIGFPGPRMSYRDDVDRHYGEAFRPAPQSLAEILGRSVTPGEEAPDEGEP